jgi:chromate transporter
MIERLRPELGQIKERLRDLWKACVPQVDSSSATVHWQTLSRTFLKLGFTGFGGGIAVIGQIRRIVVRQERWLSEEQFLDAVSLAQSLPGANAANAITYVGLKLAGIRGAIVSVVSFILPSFLMMVGLTIAHDRLHHLPDVQRVFQGLNAAVVGLIAATAARLGKAAMQRQWHLEVGVATAFVLIFMGASVAEVVLVAGITGIFIQSFNVRGRHRLRLQVRKQKQLGARTATAEHQARQSAAETIAQATNNLTADHTISTSLTDNKGERRPHDDKPSEGHSAKEPKEQPEAAQGIRHLQAWAIPLFALPFLAKFVAVWELLMVFLRVGSVTFGGGFVMIPQIETDVVDVHRWLTHQAFADGVVFGQITPGPVLITATFIGYKVAGWIGAIVATVGAFLPSFLMTLIAGASLNRFRTNHQVQAFLSGVAPAVVGMLAAAGVSLARSGLDSTLSFGVATTAFLLMLRARLNPVVIILACGVLQFAVAHYLF